MRSSQPRSKTRKSAQELHARRTSRGNALSTPEFHYYAEPENFDEVVASWWERNIHWGPTIATTWRALTPKCGQHKDREFNFIKQSGLVYLPAYFRANVESHFNAIERITDQEFLKRCEVGYEKLSDFIRGSSEREESFIPVPIPTPCCRPGESTRSWRCS